MNVFIAASASSHSAFAMRNAFSAGSSSTASRSARSVSPGGLGSS
jgi:hypothetical protein